jgi:enterochelin esterase family protein
MQFFYIRRIIRIFFSLGAILLILVQCSSSDGDTANTPDLSGDSQASSSALETATTSPMSAESSTNSAESSSPVSADSSTNSAESTELSFDGEFSSFAEFLDVIDQTSNTDQKNALVNEFMEWAGSAGFPHIEGDSAYFIYRGVVQNQITVPGDFNEWETSADAMTHLVGTDFWYLEKVFPRDARLDYKFIVDNEWQLDSLNPYKMSGGFGTNSMIMMPDYVPPPEVEYYDSIPHGRLDDFMVTSSVYGGENRQVFVYLPAGYDSTTIEYPSLYIQDGGEYLTLAHFNNVVDYLLSENAIAPVILVLVPPIDRMTEYALNDQYLEFLTGEVLPEIEARYRVIQTADQRGIMGASLGGLTSLYAIAGYSDLFGKCAGQSSALWWDDWKIYESITAALATAKPPVQFYLDCGTFESLLAENQTMRDMLQGWGYSVTYHEYHEGHSWGNWRAHLDEILTTFWPAGAEPARLSKK